VLTTPVVQPKLQKRPKGIHYSGAWEKLIHEKKLKSKISWHCPLLTPSLNDTIKKPRFFSKDFESGFFLA
jgi:hypothetical protein